MNCSMKYSGVPWIGDIPQDWNLVQGKRIFRTHKRIVGDDVDKYERLALTMNGVIKRGKDDNEGLQPEQFEGYQILRTNELVFKLIDLQNIKTSRVGLSPFDGIVSPAYITLQNQMEDNRFYYYWYTFLYHYLIFNQLAGDGVRSALNADDLLRIPIPDIQYGIQKSISDFLDKKCNEIEKLVSLQERMIEELNAYKQSIITEAVTKGLNQNASMKDSEIRWIGAIPSQWQCVKLSLVTSKIGSGSTPRGGSEVYVTQGVKFIRSQNVHFEGFNLDDVAYITEQVNEEMKGTQVQVGDILFNITGGSIGRCCYVDEDLGKANVNQHVCIVRPYNIQTKFLKYYLQSTCGQIQTHILQTGGNREGLSAEAFKEFKITYPSISEQQSIAEFLDEKCKEIEKLIEIKQKKIDELKEYKKSLIYEYVTGKKQVV